MTWSFWGWSMLFLPTLAAQYRRHRRRSTGKMSVRELKKSRVLEELLLLEALLPITFPRQCEY